MSTLDTVYALFQDRGIKYNVEKFLRINFTSKGVIPVYEYYKHLEAGKLDDLRTSLGFSGFDITAESDAEVENHAVDA
ncbi:hypothetical protein D3C71_1833270 [compost metagenome]